LTYIASIKHLPRAQKVKTKGQKIDDLTDMFPMNAFFAASGSTDAAFVCPPAPLWPRLPEKEEYGHAG
jgi:hypothetical protein